MVHTIGRRASLGFILGASVFGAFVACGGSDDTSSAGPQNDAATLSDSADASSDGNTNAVDGGDAGEFRIFAFGAPASPAGNANYAAVQGSGVVSGPVIVVPWNSIDNGGALDWSSFDGANGSLTKYSNAFPDARFSILFEPVTDVIKNTFTPDDVLASAGQQICFCDGVYPGDQPSGVNHCYANGKIDGTTPNGTGLPVPFTGTFASRWQGFISAAIARLNAASYVSRISYVTFGVSNGGEDIPRCPAEEIALAGSKTMLADTWNTDLDAQDSAIEAAHPAFPVVVGTSCLGAFEPPDGSTLNDDCDLFADREATTNASHGVGIRITTLQKADILAFSMSTPTVSDWAANTAAHPNVPIVWQTSAESAPTSTGTASCLRTGSLTDLLSFVSAHSSDATPLRAFEAYYADLEGTYASGFTDGCWPSGTVTSDPYAPYDSEFKSLVGN